MAGVDGERELEDFLAETGALSFAEETHEQPEPEPTEEVVHDEGPGFEPPPEDGAETPPRSPSEAVERAEGEQPEEPPEEGEEGEPHVVWATKKYGKEPHRWAKAAYDQERFISQLAADKKQAEEMAQEAIQYAQSIQAQSQVNSGMPMSAQEEAWVEQAMANPAGYAYQAARQGNVNLYNAIIERVAEDNASFAVQIGTQVQMALRDEQARYEAETRTNQNGSQGDFNAEMGQSFQTLGIDVEKYGQPIWEKFEELGEYHPYTLAVLGGDPIQRNLALSAVYDLVRTGQTTTRRVAETEREEQIRREGELRREAAGVVTGAPHVAPVKQSPFFDAMEEEWRRRGQWRDEE